MSIQWFPGHMTSARKKAAETLAMADVVVEVLDARLPVASSNPMIHELRAFRQRPCLKLLNKADLADPAATKAWLEFFAQQPDVKAVAISCKKPSDVARVPGLAQQLAPHRNDAVKPLRLMIMGIPNVGKSTLLNAMVKKRVAAVGDQPAVTKSQQRIDISSRLTLYDTPGMLWPKIAHPVDGLMLAASHAVGVNAYIDHASPAEWPVEYKLLGRTPTRWAPINSLYLYARMGWTLAHLAGERQRLPERGAAGEQEEMQRAGRICGREHLLTAAYDDHRVVAERTLDSHIRNLRMFTPE